MSVLKSIFIFILVYGCVSFANANAEKPVLSKERIIFHTNFGDIAVALFPELAPKHEAQMFKMVRAGVYTGAEIYRVEPGFVAQVANYDIRPIPLSVAERASVQKIPAEFNQVHHRRGILSMARFDDPNSAEASFSFVFGQAAHLDSAKSWQDLTCWTRLNT
jgi:cyclophilin family peptidyl-prolyl cis-trans isomerase